MKSVRMMAMLLTGLFLALLAGCGGGGGGGDTSQPLSGYVKYGGQPLANVTVTLSGDTTRTTTTNANGYYIFNNVDEGEYTLTASISGTTFPLTFVPPSQTAYMSDVEATDFDFHAVGPIRLSSSTHTLFVKNDKTVEAWGLNTSGQLGNGTTTSSSSPVVVSGLTSVLSVATGGDFSLALKSDGTVWAWGGNANGQLGIGSYADQSTPVQITTLTGIIAIAAGNSHAVAVKSDGTVWAWGLNTNGQLGDVSNTTRTVPVQVGGASPYDYFSSTNKAISVAAGYDHTLVLRADGYVFVWGGNSAGQLGVGSTTDCNYPVALTDHGVEVAAGYKVTAVLIYSTGNLTGLIYTCGANDKGQLGRDTSESDDMPKYLGAINHFEGIVTVSAGYNHMAAVKTDGTVWAWGGNAYGQLGIGTSDTSVHWDPVQTGTVTGIARVTAGQYDTLAQYYSSAGDAVWGWGLNSDGQLGIGSMDSDPHPTPVSVTLP